MDPESLPPAIEARSFELLVTELRVVDNLVAGQVQRLDLVALNGQPRADRSYRSYARTVEVLRRDSALKVLLYARPYHFFPDGEFPGQIAYEARGGPRRTLFLRDEAGEVLEGTLNGAPIRLFDVRRVRVRRWLFRRIVGFMRRMGCDGVFLDLCWAWPVDTIQPTGGGSFLDRAGLAGPAARDAWRRGVQRLLSRYAASTRVEVVLFNSLGGGDRARRESQEELLTPADGGNIEFFAYSRVRSDSIFSRDIEPYLDVADRHPDRLVLFDGRAREVARAPSSDGRLRNTVRYVSFEEDLHWHRYCRAAYLLASGRNTDFRYTASFSTNPSPRPRSTVLSRYFRPELGTPEDRLRLGSLYLRNFSGGVVLLRPEQPIVAGLPGVAAAERWPPEGRLAEPLYRADGTPVRRVALEPQSAEILYKRPPVLPDAAETLDLGRVGATAVERAPPQLGRGRRPEDFGKWRWATLGTDGTLTLGATPPDEVAEHDLLLPGDRPFGPRSVTIHYRAADRETRIALFAEVDDRERRRMQAAFVLAPTPGLEEDTVLPEISRQRIHGFRSARPASGWRRRELAVEQVPDELLRTGRPRSAGDLVGGRRGASWSWTASLDAEPPLGSPRYSPRHWMFVRFVGTIEVVSVRVE